MHDIEPFYNWRDLYIASEDEKSVFYGTQHSEFEYEHKVYNYYIHPQWDFFGSATLYLKLLFVDYEDGYAIMEFIGEWNDCLYNDIMFLKRDVIDKMIKRGITKFILLVENVLTFYASDDSYYEEWYDDIKDEEGWICFINTSEHIEEEMKEIGLKHYVVFGGKYASLNWRKYEPENLFRFIDDSI
ncbi:MAG: hypothetical protein KBA06_01965 [Saprospiraceae bacterium]|nr:hypothetical protein [Saprospiraceae bacterium]